MRIKRTLPALALGLALLTGCGQTTSPDATTPPSTPSAAETTAPTPEETTGEPEATAAEPSQASPAESTEPAPEPAPTPSDPDTATSAAQPGAGEWVTMEVEVKVPAEASNLTEVPQTFRDYAAQVVGTADASGCQSELTITAYHPSGFVTGTDFAPGCGASNVIWGEVDGEWGIVMSMQALLDCAEFENNDIPKGHPELQCLDTSGAQVDW
ncbi:hypothetical protein LKO27_13170 [Tessaracoccus sp. OS52]|uniref:hypothetical protein n=1 Tax=Tessaracoccus sp. OS52 TaxID=2886691 RepID=UPI001D110365|nr:hypothetical protein [Tessaracoccus sp. OS52]MCC2594355.1 hypothetical protein [Tessaracoccus sp. OS52]